MLVRKEDLHEIQRFLVRKHWEGFNFIGYHLDDGPVGKFDIDFYVNEDLVMAFCRGHPERHYLYTKTSYRAIEMAQRDNALLAYRNGCIDVAKTTENFHQNLTNQQTFNNKNSIIMIDNNFDYLNNQVIYGGFKAIPSDELRKQMELNQQDFQLSMNTAYGTDKVTATLSFSKSGKSDLYFFNHYDVEVQKEGQNDPMKQRFYINNRGSSITLKEAYNLMEGRAVHKTLTNKADDKYEAWVQLDFKNVKEDGNYKMNTYSEKYGFDLEKTLALYPIKELENHQFRDGLLDSLRRGNRQAVTLVKDGQETKRFVEAAPQYKVINFYDEHNRNRVAERTAQGQAQKDDNENEQSAKAQNSQKQQSSKGQSKAESETVQGEAAAKKRSSRRKMSA